MIESVYIIEFLDIDIYLLFGACILLFTIISECIPYS